MTAASIATARTNMVENQVRTNDVTDLDVQDAMRVVPREALCPPGRRTLAYAEARVEYASDWFLGEPREVSKLMQAIYPRRAERALCIAAPYAAMVMARIGLTVTALQPESGAPDFLKAALAGEGVSVQVGRIDELEGRGPYDVIISEGGVIERMGPTGKARLYLQGDDGQVARREIFDATPPMMPGFAAPRGFSF